ncbi:hypothetical protein COTS27_00666 [Spirochaetota bacterium]|nr:hypothetical protein COTS27_00666 [Spirochaetota bacterium]
MKHTHTPSPLPLLTFSHIKEGAAFIHHSNKIALPLHAATPQVNTTTHHSLAALKNIAFFKEPHYWVLITGIGKLPTLIALTHILTQWKTAISEVINIGCAGALTANLHAPRPAHHQAQPLTLGRVLSVGTFLGIETIKTIETPTQNAVKSATPRLTIYKKTLLSSDPHAHSTLITSPMPIGMDSNQSLSKEGFHKQIPVADIVDMEGYWNAVLAEQFGKPYSALKIISDTYNETFSLATFTQRLPKFSQILYDHAMTLLNTRGLIKKPKRALPSQKWSSKSSSNWETKIKTYMTALKDRFHFTQNETHLLHIHLRRLASKLQTSHADSSHSNPHTLWEETLTALETESLQKKTTPQQKKQYLNLLEHQLPTQRWDKVIADLENIIHDAKKHGILIHHQPSLEHVTLEIKVTNYPDWKRAAAFITSTQFQDVFTILAGDLSKWYPTTESNLKSTHSNQPDSR